jgi:enoyl-CoA hydratase/carnithine racemase
VSEAAPYRQITSQHRDGVATITLNRPERLNAWTPRMANELRTALYAAADDGDVRVIVVTGAGRGFCAGADMKLLTDFAASGDLNAKDPENIPDEKVPIRRPEGMPEDFLTEYTYLMSIPKPVIAAVNGAAAGVGLVLALAADIRLASDKARLAAVFSRRGLIAEYGISWLLPRLVGVANSCDLLFSGRIVEAEEAARLGLVNRVIAHDDFEAEVAKYASMLAEQVSPRSTAIMKRQIYGDQFRSLAESVEIAIHEMHESLGTEDFREGVAHFVEKRPAKFPRR